MISGNRFDIFDLECNVRVSRWFVVSEFFLTWSRFSTWNLRKTFLELTPAFRLFFFATLSYLISFK